MGNSYWLDRECATASTPRRGGRVDVAIVGAGITGCAAALRLAEAGLRVRVHERRTIASGASGRNGGFALRGGAEPYHLVRARLGGDAAAALWRWSERALDRMAALGGDAVRRTGSLRLAADVSERDEIRAEYDALCEDGFAAEWIEPAPPPFAGAMLNPGDGAFHPVRFVRGLAGAAMAAGAEIREHDAVDALEELDAERVVVATDGYGRGLLPELDASIRPVRNQMLSTAPLGRERFPLPHYARRGHAYWQQLREGTLLLGGFRDADPEVEATDVERTTPRVQATLDRFLRETLDVGAPVVGRWSGIFGVTDDLLPLAGELGSGIWVAAGYSGHGNVLGLACGEAVADALLGRSDAILELLAPGRADPAVERRRGIFRSTI